MIKCSSWVPFGILYKMLQNSLKRIIIQWSINWHISVPWTSQILEFAYVASKVFLLSWWNYLLERSWPTFNITIKMNEFRVWPYLRHFVPIEASRFNNDIILIVLPDRFCHFSKRNLFFTMLFEGFPVSTDLKEIKYLELHHF